MPFIQIKENLNLLNALLQNDIVRNRCRWGVLAGMCRVRQVSIVIGQGENHMNIKLLFGAIASLGMITLTSLPAFARDAVLTARFADSTVNLRSTPSGTALVRGFGVRGDRVRLLDQRVGTNRNLWYYVQTYRSGIEGWVDGTYIQPISGAGMGGPREPVTVNASDRRFLVNDYEVRVYTRNGETRLNAFNRRTNRTELRGEPVSVRRSPDGVTYTGRNAVFFLNNNGERTLSIY